jgi:hypothetical protein
MKHRLFDCLIIGCIVIGGVQAWRSGLERGRLSERLARLVRKTGDVQIADETKVHFKALETEDPLEFAWRVYFPRNYRGTLKERFAGGAAEFAASSSEYIARVRVRHHESDKMSIYSHFGSGSRWMEFEDKSLAELLRGRWGTLIVEQLGAPEVAMIKPDQQVVLLRLRLPEDIEQMARAKVSAEDLAQFVPSLLRIDLIPATSGP